MAKRMSIADVHENRASITAEEFVERKLRYVNQENRREGLAPYMGVLEFRAALRNSDREGRERLMDAVEAEFATLTNYAD